MTHVLQIEFFFSELLLNNPGSSFFFAFGAGHFVGENTIVDVVRNAGFTVEHVQPGDDLENWSSSSEGKSHGKHFLNVKSQNYKTVPLR